MKKKYKTSLALIGVLLSFVAVIGIGYGIWLNTRTDFDIKAEQLECFKVYLDVDTINKKNISPVTAEEGKKNSPYSLTVTNICTVKKELQVRLNILSESTADTKSLIIDATGNLQIDETSYKDLTDATNNNEDIKESKMLGTISIEPGETIRTNIKMWFDEKKNPIFNQEDIFIAKFELLDGEANLNSSLSDKIINLYKGTDSIDFTKPDTSNNQIISITTDQGTGYYYRGTVKNNYVSFANLLWRIVGINPDGTIKIISEENVGTSKFEKQTTYRDYVGYTYFYFKQVPNNAYEYIDSWYLNNIINNGLDNYIATEIYCNDTTSTQDGNVFYFGAYNRLTRDFKPSTTCPALSTDFGGPFELKVGYLTADEVSIAGGAYDQANGSFYLNNGTTFMTMSPAEFYPYNPTIMVVNEEGKLTQDSVNKEYGVRPVINLVKETQVTGAGTKSNPYVVQINE